MTPTIFHRALACTAFLLLLPSAGLLAASPEPLDKALRFQPPIATQLAVPPAFVISKPSAEASRRRWKKAWIASWVAFAAVNALDAHSSSGRLEANPLLRGSDGRFNHGKAIAMKSALGGAFFAFQGWMIRKDPESNYYKPFAISTGAAAAGLGAVTARNYATAR